MKPELLRVTSEIAHSFNARQDKQSNINDRWHYHKEIELIHFHKGSGTQFVGDNMSRFAPGDIVLVGSNLPHYWRFDEEYNRLADSHPYSTVIHFFDNFWGDHFLDLPENKLIRNTLQNAKSGLQIIGDIRQQIAGYMEQILVTEGPRRIIILLEVLTAIGNGRENRKLSSFGFNPHFEEDDKERINSVFEYSFANFKNSISLEEIAGVAHLSRGAFCRFFKLKTRKTYFQFITEVRIGHACKLLIENNFNVKRICYESGFSNFSSFYAAFKNVTGKTPLQYQDHFFARV